MKLTASLHPTHPMREYGFTLIELMIVVGIIGILATMGIPEYLNFTSRSKQSEAKAVLAGIVTSQTVYFSEYNTFAPTLTELEYENQSAMKYYALSSEAGDDASYAYTMTANLDADVALDVWLATNLPEAYGVADSVDNLSDDSAQ